MLRIDQIWWQFWRCVGRNRFMSFCIRFEKSHKNLLSGSLHKVSIKLEIKSGNRTFYKYYRNDYRNVYVF